MGDYVGGRLRLGDAGPNVHIRDHAVVFDGLRVTTTVTGGH